MTVWLKLSEKDLQLSAVFVVTVFFQGKRSRRDLKFFTSSTMPKPRFHFWRDSWVGLAENPPNMPKPGFHFVVAFLGWSRQKKTQEMTHTPCRGGVGESPGVEWRGVPCGVEWDFCSLCLTRDGLTVAQPKPARGCADARELYN